MFDDTHVRRKMGRLFSSCKDLTVDGFFVTDMFERFLHRHAMDIHRKNFFFECLELKRSFLSGTASADDLDKYLMVNFTWHTIDVEEYERAEEYYYENDDEDRPVFPYRQDEAFKFCRMVVNKAAVPRALYVWRVFCQDEDVEWIEARYEFLAKVRGLTARIFLAYDSPEMFEGYVPVLKQEN